MTGSDRGFSTIELAVAAAGTVLILFALGSTLVSGMRTGNIGSSQSRFVDQARAVVNQLVRDVQNSPDWDTGPTPCPGATAGTCAAFTVQTPTGGSQAVRWRLDGATLYRELLDNSGNAISSEPRSTGVANIGQSTPLFTCSVIGSLRQISVNLKVNPGTDRTFTVRTAIRQRNGYESTC